MKKSLLILAVFFTGMLFSQTFDKKAIDELSEFIGKKPSELAEKYSLKLTKHSDNFGDFTDQFSGYKIEGEDCALDVVSANNSIKEITVYKNNDFKSFFLNTGTILNAVSEDSKNNYKINHRIYSSRVNYYETFAQLIENVKNKYPLSDYSGFARFNNLPKTYEMFLMNEGVGFVIKK